MIWERFKAIAWEIHTHLGTWYSYLVAGSIALQASASDINAYISGKARHWILGIATVIVLADRVYKSIYKIKT